MIGTRSRPRSYVSTARRSGAQRYTRLLVEKLPKGPVLNVGAGYTSTSDVGHWSVDLDLVLPAGMDTSTFVTGDVAFAPFRDNSFMGALLKDVLEHVEDVIGVLREVRRVVAPGGRVVIITPRAIPRAVWDDPTHVRGFTSRAISTAVELGGWTLCRKPARIGAIPGIGRLGLEHRLETLMRIPGVGHWFGTNWLVEAERR